MNDIATLVQSEPSIATHRLRVAFFSDSLAERNGTGAYYHDLIDQLRSRIACAGIIQPQHRTGFHPLSFPLPGDTTQKLSAPNLLHVRRELARIRPHVIVSATPGPFGLLGPWMARRYQCGFISAYHTHFEGLADIYWRPFKRHLISGCLNSANRFLCQRSATVLVNNPTLGDTVMGLGAKQYDVMGTPLERGFVEAAPPPLPETVTQICFAGRLAAEKNIDAILQAAQDWPTLRFVIGGDGPLKAKVESYAARYANIDYRGWLDRHTLRDLIDESSLLVLPSHQETFGSIALEAMARGRPALVSENAGIHDWTQLAAGLYKIRSQESLSDAIARLQADPPGALTAVAAKARTAALQLNEHTLDQWLTVLAEQAKGAP
ncbi:glycosyltransferase [Aidingimonas lacisalsi]|uniref:glycosyltransferase n=1 Tax=Aidingimonas lacisalsi TaxID=2604086 RepID=UPI0011D232DB|nr:glycosyltransferase [Aidingimonas lacisalsi]